MLCRLHKNKKSRGSKKIYCLDKNFLASIGGGIFSGETENLPKVERGLTNPPTKYFSQSNIPATNLPPPISLPKFSPFPKLFDFDQNF